jgi:CRISPR type III-B/RAMP module-associated protein Cmr5
MIDLDHKRGRLAADLVNQLRGLQRQGDDDVTIPLAGGAPVRVPGALKEKNAEKTKGAFLQEVRATPILIHQSGLLQALAFCNAKGEARRLVWLCVLHWLKHSNGNPVSAPGFSTQSVTDAENTYVELMHKSPVELRADTAEAQAFLIWLKQFSEVHFKGVGDGD